MWASLVKSKILQKHQFWRIFCFFHFCSKWSPFSSVSVNKCQFLIEILSFLKEISSVFESVNFWWRCFLLVKNNNFGKNDNWFFYAKIVRFWANEWNSKSSDKIMSCKLWGKVKSVSEYQFWCKNVNIEILGEMLTFSLSVPYNWKWLCYCKICLFFEEFFHFCSQWSQLSNILVFNGDIKYSKRSVFCFWKESIFGRVVLF